MQLHDAIDLITFYSTLRGSQDLSFYALKGKEGDRITLTAKLSFGELSIHFDQVDGSKLPEGVMLQRELTKSRSKAIANYILSNPDFVFPELVAIVEAFDIEETHLNGIVRALIKKEAFRYFVDGQGRLMAIKSALAANPKLADNTIDIKFVLSRGVESDAQIFTDINKSRQQPNTSQCIAMDSRQLLSRFTRKVVSEVSLLNGIVDYTKASVTRSGGNKVYTLSQMSNFIRLLVNVNPTQAEQTFSNETEQKKWISFIDKLFTHALCNQQFKNVLNGEKQNLETIISTAVFLKSFAIFGRVAVMNMIAANSADWTFMERFSGIDFSVNNTEWLGRCLNYRGKFEDKTWNHKAVASYLCFCSGLEVPEELDVVEEEVLVARAQILKQQREAKKSAMEQTA